MDSGHPPRPVARWRRIWEEPATTEKFAHSKRLTAGLIAASYTLAGGLWIVYSDSLLGSFVRDLPAVVSWSTVKGLFFVAVTGAGLYALTRHFTNIQAEAESAKAGAEQIHASVLNALPNIVFTLDPTDAVKTWNDEALVATGYPPEFVASRNVVDFVAEHDKERARAALKSVLRGKRVTVRLDARHHDGAIVPYQFLAVPLMDDAGRVAGAVCTGRDVSEEVRGERALLRSLAGHSHVLEQTVDAIAALIEQRDRYLSGHQDRVTQLSLAIAEKLELDHEIMQGLRLAAKCHDIGKIHIPAEILAKPGRITEAEFEMIKAHPRIGYEILRRIDFPWPVAEIVRQHHERYDGSGYPRRLRGDAIRIEARILGVADTVEAMTSHRPYRPGLGIRTALEEIRKGRNTRYDPAVADACLAVFREGFEFEHVEKTRPPPPKAAAAQAALLTRH